jgi:hypothetical protein
MTWNYILFKRIENYEATGNWTRFTVSAAVWHPLRVTPPNPPARSRSGKSTRMSSGGLTAT